MPGKKKNKLQESFSLLLNIFPVIELVCVTYGAMICGN